MNPINFVITQADGFYTASAVEASVITQAATFDELLLNIREALSLHFEDSNIPSPFFNILYSGSVIDHA